MKFSKEALRALLKERKMKSKEVAQLLGITGAAVSQVLCGRREPSARIEEGLKQHFPECFVGAAKEAAE